MLAVRAIAALAVGAAMMFESWAFIMPHQAPTDTLILVNKANRAPTVPVTLVKPNVTPTKEAVSENIYMQPEAAKALEGLFEAALAENIGLHVCCAPGLPGQCAPETAAELIRNVVYDVLREQEE